MLDSLDPFVGIIKLFGPFGIAIFVVYSIIRGWLIPGRTSDKMLADKDAQIRNLWKANDSNSQVLGLMNAQLGHMANNAELTVLLLQALRAVAADSSSADDRKKVVLGEVPSVAKEE